jgi:hypothetical protein
MSAEVTGGTGAATRHAIPDASKSVIARVPLHPRLTACQNRSRPIPKGDTTPIPVMAMRMFVATYNTRNHVDEPATSNLGRTRVRMGRRRGVRRPLAWFVFYYAVLGHREAPRGRRAASRH